MKNMWTGGIRLCFVFKTQTLADPLQMLTGYISYFCTIRTTSLTETLPPWAKQRSVLQCPVLALVSSAVVRMHDRNIPF